MDALLRWAKPVRADIAGPVDTSVDMWRLPSMTPPNRGGQCIPGAQERGIPCTIFAISGLLGSLVRWGKYSDRIMSADELRSLDSDTGYHRFAHGVASDANIAVRNLRPVGTAESRAQLERLLQRKVIFSASVGAFNTS